MQLTKRERVTHLLNRFGLGASPTELDAALAQGEENLLARLISYDSHAPTVDVDPYQFVFESDSKVNMDAHRMQLHWLLEMATTSQPGREKLTLFWHSHFAVSGAKVGFGPAMLQYLTTLRANSNGKFPDLLERVSKTPAMIHWLDTEQSVPLHPNENFAREVMELFTLGIGNYTEEDIREAAKVFCGWSFRTPFYELRGKKVDEQAFARQMLGSGTPMVAFLDCPDMRPATPIHFRGKKEVYTPESLLQTLALDPATAKRLCRKLWEFYAYASPEPELIDRLAEAYLDSQGDIQAVLLKIARSPEFWSDRCVGTMVKNPVDFTIGTLRLVGASNQLMTKTVPSKDPYVAAPKDLLTSLYLVSQSLARQGLSPLYPPDVSGWTWGETWARPAIVLERSRLPQYVFNSNEKGGPPSAFLLDRLIQAEAKGTPESIVDYICKSLGVRYSEPQKKVLVSACTKAGGATMLKNRRLAATLLRAVTRFVFMSPEYQLC